MSSARPAGLSSVADDHKPREGLILCSSITSASPSTRGSMTAPASRCVGACKKVTEDIEDG